MKNLSMDFVPLIQIRGANLKSRIAWETYHHKNSLPVDVVEAMRPVFRELANPELLKSVYMEPGDYTVQAMECLDKRRLLRAKYYCLQKTKEVRKEKKRLKRKKEDDELLKNADNLEYGAKMF
ncbi:uncharacterized protein TNCV_4761541 [Trichonephila clavipes]|uniref:Uncharacterized protein n=1 Tax=Trichonephila clavipes TaxID=2585209 RepID=A0A8X6REP9_TRICX|nr:uncharacterized protein TNCV_4761541 [Trichonephila clavipes]